MELHINDLLKICPIAGRPTSISGGSHPVIRADGPLLEQSG
jgi:hypothetical protein